MANNLQNLSFEQAYNELNEIIQQLERGGISLEKSLQLYERGQALSVHCEQLLDNAELRVNQIDENTATTDDDNGNWSQPHSSDNDIPF